MKTLIFTAVAASWFYGLSLNNQAPHFVQTSETASGVSKRIQDLRDCPNYAHKTGNRIALSPASQKIDEMVREYLCHGVDRRDNYSHLLTKSLRKEKENLFPELIRRFNAFNLDAVVTEKQELESFLMIVIIADDLDNRVIRLRGSEHGLRVIDSLKAAVDRMKRAETNKKYLEQFVGFVDNLTGVNVIDQFVANTLQKSYKIRIADKEQLEFSNFLVALDPSYPSWSHIDKNGVLILKDSNRFYLAYLKFRKV